jgi:hypothetical protein
MPRLGGTGIFVAFVIAFWQRRIWTVPNGILLGAAVVFSSGSGYIYRLSPGPSWRSDSAALIVFTSESGACNDQPFDGYSSWGP